MNKDRKQRIYDEGRRDGFYEGVRAERMLAASQIVRCRDCVGFAFGDADFGTVDWCDYWGDGVESPDGFCAWGERMDDA